MERLAGFDERLRLKDTDLDMMDTTTSDPVEPTFDGLLEGHSLAMFSEEIAQAESRHFLFSIEFLHLTVCLC